jgi:eukaryotic-like serine/threonine-protein kinase
MAKGVTQGQVLGGKLRLVEPLAADPLLEVWLAEDLELTREVVVKVLHPRWMDDEAMVERFRFEALAAARLDHENVARTFDVEHSDGALFTVSEYVPGPTVYELLEHAPLAATVVAAIGHQSALGLAAAHEEGMVHGAVCPQNLVISPQGRVCLIDFGSVRPVDADHEEPDPVFPEPRTRLYWPPERLAGHTVDERGDVYSAGLLMREAATGSREPEGDDERGLARRVLAALRGGDTAAARLRDVLAVATAEDPADRPTAADLADALGEICGARPQEPVAELLAGVADVG